MTFGGLKASNLHGIAPLVNHTANHAKREKLKAEKLRQQMEASQKLAEEQRKREEQKRLDEERERQRIEAERLERAKQEQLARIERLSTSTELCSELLDEYLSTEVTEAELNKYLEFEQRSNEMHASLIEETVAELLLHIADEIYQAKKNIMRKYFNLWQYRAAKQIKYWNCSIRCNNQPRHA